jgi:hypothetical protein
MTLLMKSRAERVFEMLRPAVVGPMRIQYLPQINSTREWVVWCECHPEWLFHVVISYEELEKQETLRGPPFTAVQRGQTAFEMACQQAEELHRQLLIHIRMNANKPEATDGEEAG